MADLKTSSLALTKMKVRWEEPYSSEAINRGHLTLPAGIYRGGQLVPTSPESTSFKLVPDDGGGVYQQTLFLYRDTANGFAVVVRDADEVTFDMSAEFPLGGAVTWYVWADVDYSTGVPTSGTYHVSDTAPPTDAVIFGQLDFTGSETDISATEIKSTGRVTPDPTKREDGAYVGGDEFYGMLSGEEAWNIPTSDHKRAMNNAATPPTASNPFVTEADTLDKYFGEPTFVSKTGLSAVSKVQLTGNFYVGDGAAGTAEQFFSLRDATDKRHQLRDPNSDYRHVWVGQVNDSGDVGQLDPSSDADSEGFYSNPWIYFESSAGVHTYTGDLNVAALQKKQFSALAQGPVRAFPFAFLDLFPHAGEVMNRARSGSPDDLTQNDVGEHIAYLLSYINARIKTIAPESSPSTWILLWRSHNVTSDPNVTKSTISIYWGGPGGAPGFMILVGGYLDDDEVVAGTGTTGDDVTMMWMEPGNGGFTTAVKSGPTAADRWYYDGYANWDTFVEQKAGTGRVLNPEISVQDTTVIKGISTAERTLLFTNDVTPATRLYHSGPASNIMLTFNCSWVAVGNKWTRDSAGYDAFGFEISSGGIKFYNKYSGDAGTDWDDDSTGWTAIFQWGGPVSEAGGVMPGASDIYNCFEAFGDLYERCPYAFFFKNIGASGITGPQMLLYQGMQYHNRWDTDPTSLTILPMKTDAGGDCSASAYAFSVSPTYGENWGFYVAFAVDNTKTLAAADSAEVDGVVEVYS